MEHTRGKGEEHQLYTVDEKGYRRFCEAMGWTPEEGHFPCRPKRDREEQLVRPAPAKPAINLYPILKPEPTRNVREAGQKPMSRRERDQIVKRCLGKLGPTHQARCSLSKKLATFQRERNRLADQAKDFKQAAYYAWDEKEKWVLKDVAKGLDDLADKHDLAYRGLRRRLN